MTGIYSLTRAEYDALAGRVNWSTLKEIGRSPAHYRHRLTHGDDRDTDALVRGRVVHLAVFEPARFRESVAIWDGGTRRGKDWDRFKIENAGHEMITESTHALAVAIANAARSSPQSAALLSRGRAESTVLWDHTGGGLDILSAGLAEPGAPPIGDYVLQCKARLDIFADGGAIVDLKTARDASPDGFGRACANYAYHVQAAWYRDGYKKATGKALPFVFVAVEIAPPFVVQVYAMTDELLSLGRETYLGYCDRLAMCRASNSWPGYSDGPLDLTLPRWAAPREDEDVEELIGVSK